MSNMHAALLPNGLKDLLPPRAEQEARIIDIFMREFSSFGYSRVKPPLVEFEDSLLGSGPGQVLSRDTFRLMDPVSRRMMGVRADTTAQIARIATSRLASVERPLRLSYAADVLRVQGSQLRPERQFCQVGCEMIGADSAVDSAVDNAELILVAVHALSAAGIKGLSVDLTLPSLIGAIYEAHNVTDADRARLGPHIERRDRDALRESACPAAVSVAGLLDCAGRADMALEKLKALGLPAQAQEELNALRGVYAQLSEALGAGGLQNSVNITIDPVEHRGLEYQTGISFTLFAAGVRGELGSGGQYNITVSGNTEGTERKTENASGFTLYMDSILRAAPEGCPEKRIWIAREENWGTIRNLQAEGWQVARGGAKDGCTHVLENGKAKEIKH